jgi:hypothetical protein
VHQKSHMDLSLRDEKAATDRISCGTAVWHAQFRLSVIAKVGFQ